MRPILALLALVLLIFSDSASAQQLGPEVAVFEIQIGRNRDLLPVVIGFYDTDAPQTVENFKKLVRRKFYNNMRFHRVFPNSLVQSGDPNSRRGPSDRSGTGGPGYTVPAEIKLQHKTGAIAMSRLANTINPAKASNGSQFYVCLEPLPKLNGEYTVFGEVLEGMEILRDISTRPTDSNDFPLDKIVIKRVTLQPRLASSEPSR